MIHTLTLPYHSSIVSPQAYDFGSILQASLKIVSGFSCNQMSDTTRQREVSPSWDIRLKGSHVLMAGRIFKSKLNVSYAEIERYTVLGWAARSSFIFACSRHFHKPMVSKRKIMVKNPNIHISWAKCIDIPWRVTCRLIYPVLRKVWVSQSYQQRNAHS